jgi:hypothetical protein
VVGKAPNRKAYPICRASLPRLAASGLPAGARYQQRLDRDHQRPALLSPLATQQRVQSRAARNVEIEIRYGDAALHVRIRDDGRGISPDVLDACGALGHFGLPGMRERTKKLGAHLEVWSKPGVGTEVDLRVPVDVAYKRSPEAARGLRSWLSPAMR